MKGLDLRKFKKLHSDESKTTLVHPDGHRISIAHTKIKPELAEQLKALPKFAEGGFVENAVKTLKEAFEEKPKPKDPKQVVLPNDEDAKKMKKVFSGDKYADGGEIPDYTDSMIDQSERTPEMVQQLQQPQVDAAPEASGASGSWEGAVPTSPQDISALGDLKTEESEPAPPSAAPDIYSQLQKPQQRLPLAQPNMSGPADQIAGVQKEANAIGAMGNQEAVAASDYNKKILDINSKYEERAGAMSKEIENVTHDIQNGHIDPKHFWNSKSDMGKIGTAIGLILGGIGGGMTHQENPALKFLNAQIDRDVDSQKQEMNNKHTLLTSLEKQFGNMQDATKMAKAMYADVYAAKIAEAAAKSKDPVAQARAQQAIGQIKAATLPLVNELAKKQTILEAMNQGMVQPEEAVQHVVPKEHQKEVFSEIKRAQDAQHNESAILQNFDKASKENTVMRRTFQHAGAEPASLANTRNLLMPILKDNEGRINETEIKMMEDFLPKAGDSDTKIEQKRNGLMAFIQAKKSAPTARGFGIDLQKLQSTQPAAQGFNSRK